MDLAGRLHGRSAASAVAFVACLATLFAVAVRADAAELVYWDNYRAEPGSIGFANIDGSGGGAVNLTGAELVNPEGMAIDTATGRLYVARSGERIGEVVVKPGQILYANLDGSGAGALATPGAEVNEPLGVAIDPTTRTIYWANGRGGPEGKGSIAYAKLDGSGGGLLNTAPITVSRPYRLAIDPVSGKVFWDNSESDPDTLAFANLNNTGGGGTLSLPTPQANMYGIAVDSAAGRVYWLNSEIADKRLQFANVNGVGGGEISLAGAVLKAGYGLAVDPTVGRIYWGNYGEGGSVPEAIGFVSLAGGGGAITPTSAPVNGAQDPVILKSPTGIGAPVVTRAKSARSSLSCSAGSWAADLAGAFVYQAPTTYAYQWARNGKPLKGATTAKLTAKSEGKYACTVTAANAAGSAAQTSGGIKVNAAKLKLAVKTKKVSAKAGGVATLKVQATNQGDLQAKKPKLCVKVPKKAKKVLKASKCASLGKLKGHGKKVAKLKVKVGANAVGAYKLKIVPKGTGGKAGKATLKVLG